MPHTHTHTPSRPLEYPDWVESADSDVADITELENPDRPEAGLEKRPGAWPLHLSSNQEPVDSGLALLLAVQREVLPLTTGGPESRRSLNKVNFSTLHMRTHTHTQSVIVQFII